MTDKKEITIDEYMQAPHVNSHYDRAIGYAKSLKAQEENIYESKQELADIEKMAQNIRTITKLQIANARTAEGKKKYPNQDARDAAVNKELENDTNYKNLIKSIGSLQRVIATSEINHKYIYRLYRIETAFLANEGAFR